MAECQEDVTALSVLDRLNGLREVISPELVRQVLVACGRGGQRACGLSHEVMTWIVLAMGILTELPIRQVHKHSRFLRPGEKTPGRSALCEGRKRLGPRPLKDLFDRVVRPLATQRTRGCYYRGRLMVGIDGTQIDLPDTERNARFFGYPQGGRGQGAFPQVRKLTLVELGTHVEFAFNFGPLSQGEQTLAARLHKKLPKGCLLFQDKNFFSYESWKRLRKQGVHILARVKKNLVFPVLKTFADGSFLSKIYKTTYEREKDRNGIFVRVLRYTLDDPQRVGHGEVHLLITSLLSPRHAPAEELISAYHERWEHELTIDEQKTHQDPKRATKPAMLRSQSPRNVVQELYALSIGHFVVRALMHEAALQTDVDPDRLSFTGAFQILKARLPECGTRLPLRDWYTALLWEISQEKLPPRRNRINPRVIKQKIKKWPQKRAEHRHPPPLTKAFQDSVVMIP